MFFCSEHVRKIECVLAAATKAAASTHSLGKTRDALPDYSTWYQQYPRTPCRTFGWQLSQKDSLPKTAFTGDPTLSWFGKVLR